MKLIVVVDVAAGIAEMVVFLLMVVFMTFGVVVVLLPLGGLGRFCLGRVWSFDSYIG